MKLTTDRLRTIIKEELSEMARPKGGMSNPQYTFGDKVSLKFNTNEKRNHPEYKASHGKSGRIYDIEDTPHGSFYIIRLFHAVKDDQGNWHEKIYKIRDKNIKSENQVNELSLSPMSYDHIVDKIINNKKLIKKYKKIRGADNRINWISKFFNLNTNDAVKIQQLLRIRRV